MTPVLGYQTSCIRQSLAVSIQSHVAVIHRYVALNVSKVYVYSYEYDVIDYVIDDVIDDVIDGAIYGSEIPHHPPPLPHKMDSV